MNHLGKLYTEIEKAVGSVIFSNIFLSTGKVAAIVPCLHYSAGMYRYPKSDTADSEVACQM